MNSLSHSDAIKIQGGQVNVNCKNALLKLFDISEGRRDEKWNNLDLLNAFMSCKDLSNGDYWDSYTAAFLVEAEY
jgi:hypothetical protein